MMNRKIYTFTRISGFQFGMPGESGIKCTVYDSRIKGRNAERSYGLTPSTYNRWRELTRNPVYLFTILPAEEGFGWRITRDVKPRRCCEKCGALALPDDIFCRYHRACEDAVFAGWQETATDFDAATAPVVKPMTYTVEHDGDILWSA